MKRLPLPATILAFICALSGISSAQTNHPNVLLVLVDDLGYSDLGCYGGEIPTPNIDSLGKNGLRFTHMATSARCSPTRASLLTGLHPAQAGIPDFQGRIAENSATLAEVLRDSGYLTYMTGKWHLGDTPESSPISRGFMEFYGYTNGHSAGQWNPGGYKRLPADHPPELNYKPGDFYATDAFTDYTLEFIRQAETKKQPWFAYLAHSSPHFPIHAPKESAAGFVDTYRRGWDVLREERFKRMQKLGLADHDGWKLTPRSLVPVEGNPAITNGYSGQPNPAWESLDEDRREDLAQRMALYAAMVKHVDDGIGRIVAHLKQSGTYDNTLILFLSDNGACYEWGPFGFDGVSRAAKNVLHPPGSLTAMGGPGSHLAYGSGWATLSNTPFRLYKHFTHEGGINTPFIIHWPQGITQPGRWVRDRAHVIDIMPTLAAATSSRYPDTRDARPVPPPEGISLLPVLQSANPLPERSICIQHEGAAAIQKSRWKLVKGKRFPQPAQWELYDLQADPVEMNDLAAAQPDILASLSAEWFRWAARTGTPTGQPTKKDQEKSAD